MTKRQKFFSALGRFFKNIFTKNVPLKIVALLFAVLLWGYVLAVENPEYTKRVRDVEISITGEDALNARGLMLVTRDIATTDVDVLCRISKHSELDASRVSCFVDLANRAISLDENENSKTISLDVQTSIASDYGKVQSLSVSSVDLTVARLSTRNNIQVGVRYTGSLPEGYVVNVPSSLSISLTGQKSELDQIARGEVVVDLETFPVNDPETLANTYDRVLPVQFYNSANVRLDGITESNGEAVTANVRVIISAYKEVGIVPTIKMLEEGYEWSYVLSRDTVTLYGDRATLDSINEIRTEAITAVPSMKESKTLVELILPEGVDVPADFKTTISVTITVSEKTSERELEIPITYQGAEGVTRKEGSVETVRVRVKGTVVSLQAFKPEWITATVDLSGLGAGTHELPIRFETSDKANAFTVEPTAETVTVELVAEHTP